MLVTNIRKWEGLSGGYTVTASQACGYVDVFFRDTKNVINVRLSVKDMREVADVFDAAHAFAKEGPK